MKKNEFNKIIQKYRVTNNHRAKLNDAHTLPFLRKAVIELIVETQGKSCPHYGVSAVLCGMYDLMFEYYFAYGDHPGEAAKRIKEYFAGINDFAFEQMTKRVYEQGMSYDEYRQTMPNNPKDVTEEQEEERREEELFGEEDDMKAELSLNELLEINYEEE